MYTHKQVIATNIYSGETSCVDEGLKDLLEALWASHIDTYMSCQENFPGIAWISFPSSSDLEALTKLLLLTNWDYFGEKIENQSALMKSVARTGRWHTKVDLFQSGFVHDDEFIHINEIDMAFSVRFPVGDISKIMESLSNVKRK